MRRRLLICGVVVTVLCASPLKALAGKAHDGGKAEGSGNRPLAGWEQKRSAEATVPPNSSAELIASCSKGKVPLGGGYSKAPSTPDSSGGVEIAASFPAFFSFEGQRISGWIVHVVNRGTQDALVTVWVTCAGREPRANDHPLE
jgi:hypothetical protein